MGVRKGCLFTSPVVRPLYSTHPSPKGALKYVRIPHRRKITVSRSRPEPYECCSETSVARCVSTPYVHGPITVRPPSTTGLVIRPDEWDGVVVKDTRNYPVSNPS